MCGLEINFDADRVVTLNIPSLNSDHDVLPSLTPRTWQHDSDYCMYNDTRSKKIVNFSNRRPFPDEVFSQPCFSQRIRFFRKRCVGVIASCRSVFCDCPRPPPIHDEQRRERNLSVRVLARPVLAPRLGAQVETFCLGVSRQQREDQECVSHERVFR
jgi:hypothetical protein